MLVTDTHENTAPAADQNEQGSGTIPEAQEVLEDNSSDKGALPSINFDVPTENIPQRQLTTAEILEMLDSASKKFNLLLQAIQNITANAPSPAEISDFLFNKMQPFFENFKEAKEYAELLKPYIEKELKKSKKLHPEIENISPEDIAKVSVISLMGADEAETKALLRDYSDKDPILENIDTILDILRKSKENFAAASNKDLLPQIKAKKITELQYPIDKVNASLWGLIPVNETTALKAESDRDGKKGKQASIYVLLDFDELDGVRISRQLTSYDKRVFIAVANLRAQGHDTITAWQVYNAMGGASHPKKDTIEKIIQSIETLSKCRVTIDNTEEAKLYTRYDRVKATFYLLPTEICSGYAKGIIVENAIKVLEIPKLFTFAEQRGQLTTVPLRLFKSPISKTKANLLLEDYLFNRIARMKNSPKITRIILLETVYQKCNVTTYKQKARLPEKIERLLQFYKDESWIKGFIITEHSIEIKT